MSKNSTDQKEDLRVRRTHKLLLDALTSLLEEKSFEEIYVTDICDTAMVHRTTFYKHFEDKYHLLKFGITALENDFDKATLATESSSNPKEYYRKMLRHLLCYLADNKKLALLVLVKSESNSFLTLLHKSVSEGVQCKLEETKKKGIIQHVPIPVISEFHVGALIALVRWWLENNMPIEQEELINYVDLMINGDKYIFIP